MENTLLNKAKLATAGAFLAFGLVTGGVMAQATPTEEADPIVAVPAAVEEEEDEGFDDWGLLGLLGLLGLAGLRKNEPEARTVERRETRVVEPTVDNTRTTRTDIDPR